MKALRKGFFEERQVVETQIKRNRFLGYSEGDNKLDEVRFFEAIPSLGKIGEMVSSGFLYKTRAAKAGERAICIYTDADRSLKLPDFYLAKGEADITDRMEFNRLARCLYREYFFGMEAVDTMGFKKFRISGIDISGKGDVISGSVSIYSDPNNSGAYRNAGDCWKNMVVPELKSGVRPKILFEFARHIYQGLEDHYFREGDMENLGKALYLMRAMMVMSINSKRPGRKIRVNGKKIQITTEAGVEDGILEIDSPYDQIFSNPLNLRNLSTPAFWKRKDGYPVQTFHIRGLKVY